MKDSNSQKETSERICANCNGTGEIEGGVECQDCKGTGIIEVSKD